MMSCLIGNFSINYALSMKLLYLQATNKTKRFQTCKYDSYIKGVSGKDKILP